MRKLDKYILAEFLGPFLFGMGVFFMLLFGISLLPTALNLMVREKIPASVGIPVMLDRLPMILALTVPMAAMFGSLMCYGRLSGDGEIVAMRSAGVSVRRLGSPVMIAGAVIAVAMTYVTHIVGPACNGRAREILTDYRKNSTEGEHIVLRIPSSGTPQRIIYIGELNLRAQTVKALWILEFRKGQPWETLFAREGYWDGKNWVLDTVQHTELTPEGPRTENLRHVTFDLGRSPAELAKVNYDTDEMTTPTLRRQLKVAMHGKPPDPSRADDIRMEIAGRWAIPWAAFGFAMMGVVLGIRPQRTTRGVALGISLGVILAYYLILHTMAIVAEQGRLPAILCAWAPNLALFAMGVAGLIGSDG